MNRKQKIIVSVTGIFLVLLIIVGLTYAYFLTQIKGNTNNKSISVTTANLILTYADGNGVLETGDKLRPGSSVNFKTASGTTVNEKTFTVTNSGDDTDYVVIVDNVTVSPEPFKTNDFKYTLTCKSYEKAAYETSGDSASETGTCDGVTSSTFFLKNQSILVGNKIDSNIIHVYSLTMEYIDNGQNQSDDMGKTFTARINIEDIKRINPYSNDTSSLAYNIINNSMLNKNGTELSATTLSKVAEDVSIGKQRYVITNDKIATYGSSALTVSNQQFIINALTNGIEWAFTCFNSNYESNGNEGCYDVKLGFSTCEDVKGKYIYNQEEGTPWYVEDCIDEGISVYSGFAGLSPEILAGAELDEQLSYNIDESVLSATQDDYGTSFYYRGYIKDNYVNFAGMCWRIVRIDGLGNTKLILEDQYAECNDTVNNDKNNDNIIYTGAWDIPASNGESLTIDTSTNEPFRTGNFGYDASKSNRWLASYLNPVTYPERSMVNAFKYFQKTNLNGYTSKLTTGNWCYNDTAYSDEIGTNIIDKQSYYNSGAQFYYDSYVRLVGDGNIEKNPTLKCNGTVMNKYNDNTDMLVGTLTADEIMYAGGKYNDWNKSYYLLNTYQMNNTLWFLSLSPSLFFGDYDYAFVVDGYGDVNGSGVGSVGAFRPAVSLESGVGIVAGGEGTKTNPYEIG